MPAPEGPTIAVAPAGMLGADRVEDDAGRRGASADVSQLEQHRADDPTGGLSRSRKMAPAAAPLARQAWDRLEQSG